jgi:hypothetical protein
MKIYLIVLVIFLVMSNVRILFSLSLREQLLKIFETETSITNYTERITYDDLSTESPPLTLFNIHVTNSSRDKPFILLVDILYLADVHDIQTDELKEAGITKVKLLFFINGTDFYYALRYRTDFTFDQTEKIFSGKSIICHVSPVFDSNKNQLTLKVQNSSGIDALDGSIFSPSGILRNQVAFIKYRHNVNNELHFFGDVFMTNKINVTLEQQLFFDQDTSLDACFNIFQFVRAPEALMTIAENATVTTHNIIFKDFSPQHIALEPQAALIFDNGTTIELAKNEDLAMTWTFRGACTINGRGQTLSLKPLGIIVIDGQGSSLLFDNIIVDGVSLNNIRCLDNSCTISLRRSTIKLSGDFLFEKGRLVILDHVNIQGKKNFEYQTTQQSTIASGGCLKLERNCTFYYKPSVADRALLKMENEDSSLWLSGATLNVSTTGLDLSQGTLIIENKCFLYNSDARSLSEGIIIDNVDIFPGASITLLSGILDYQSAV